MAQLGRRYPEPSRNHSVEVIRHKRGQHDRREYDPRSVDVHQPDQHRRESSRRTVSAMGTEFTSLRCGAVSVLLEIIVELPLGDLGDVFLPLQSLGR